MSCISQTNLPRTQPQSRSNRPSRKRLFCLRADEGSSMNPVPKSLWFIESHFTDNLSLDDVAGAAGVSRYHMSRVFSPATGCPVPRYLRGRHLTDAARP